MKSADEYAELAETMADGARDEGVMSYAQVYATLALASATLEAARLMGPTPEDQARLRALAPWAISDPDNCPAVTREESEMWDRPV